MEGSAGNSDDFKVHREKPVKKQSGHKAAKTNIIEDEEKRNFRRDCLVEKLMEKGKNEKPMSKNFPDLELDSKSSLQENNDVLSFSSTSSSNSDSSGALSLSDTEFFGPPTEPKVSCFATRPKPVRTGTAPARGNKSNPQKHYTLFGEYQNNEKNKSRHLKLYANLKTRNSQFPQVCEADKFDHLLFNNNVIDKKSKNANASKDYGDSKSPKTQSTCSSATSFSRSCLSKHSLGSREKTKDGAQWTVRFHPVSMIVDEDSRRIYKESSQLSLRDQILDDLKLRKMEKSRKFEKGRRNVLKGYNSQSRDDYSVFRKIDNSNWGNDYDEISDSSSDLFELDHLSLFGGNSLRKEHPVYETTRSIGNHLIP